jgi:hypothetical protein
MSTAPIKTLISIFKTSASDKLYAENIRVELQKCGWQLTTTEVHALCREAQNTGRLKHGIGYMCDDAVVLSLFDGEPIPVFVNVLSADGEGYEDVPTNRLRELSFYVLADPAPDPNAALKVAPIVSTDCGVGDHKSCEGEESAIWPDGTVSMRKCSCKCHVAAAAAEEDPTKDPVYCLTRAQEAHTKYWDALHELEAVLGFEIELDHVGGDVGACTIESLTEKFGPDAVDDSRCECGRARHLCTNSEDGPHGDILTMAEAEERTRLGGTVTCDGCGKAEDHCECEETFVCPACGDEYTDAAHFERTGFCSPFCRVTNKKEEAVQL